MTREPLKAATTEPFRKTSIAGGRNSPRGLPARRAALQILIRVERDQAFADALLGHRLSDFADIDRRLITQLVLGTIAWQGRLDFELSHHSSRPLNQLAPEVLSALRMGLFQLRMLNRIPPHAAVDTAVSLTRELAGIGGAGFVNAVLRNALRNPVGLPPRQANAADYLAIAYSHPRWLVETLVTWFGMRAAETMMMANNEAAPNVLRLNLGRATPDELLPLLAREGMTVVRHGPLPETAVINGAPVLEGELWSGGLFQLQGEASQLVSRLLAPRPGTLVIDCAAAPGGKTTHLAELIGPDGKVLALDLSLAGLRNVRSTASRLRHRNVLIVRADTSLPLPLRPRSADFVLLDAPCSGLGTLRQHPEIRWRLTQDRIERMAIIQQKMLNEVSTVVADGGVLVYAVCSFAPQEGPAIINTFLAENDDFELDRMPPMAEQLRGILDADGYMKTRPDVHGIDGFFAARLRRRT